MLLNKIELQNLLSFKRVKLTLEPLNVLIGPNASGKSNLIRAISFLRALPRDLQAEISSGGGARGWINRRTGGPARISIYDPNDVEAYSIEFQESDQSYEILEEHSWGFQRTRDHVVLGPRSLTISSQTFSQKSVLSEIRHPDEVTIMQLASALETIQLYREFTTGPNTSTRRGISSSAMGAYLLEDGANLALVLGEMGHHKLLDRVSQCLGKLSNLLEEVTVLTRGGITQFYVREKGVSQPLAATALSDGTLKLLCLLAVLLDPTPPPLVCIEEPEAGLHPDAIRIVAELLSDAAQRMQLVVTTHSPALIDALSSQPESVVVCERDFDGFTQFRRLRSNELDEWLEEYTLGQLWQKGEIGGNRW